VLIMPQSPWVCKAAPQALHHRELCSTAIVGSIRRPLNDRETDTGINGVNTAHPSNIEGKCHDQTPPKRQSSIDAESSEMS